MDEFQNLNWLWKTSGASTSSLYKKQFSGDEKDIFFCHLNEIDHIHLLDDYGKHNLHTENIFIRKDPRTGQEVTKELYDHSTCIKTLLFANFPQRSSMNSTQHQSCLNAIAKLRSDTTSDDASMTDRNDIRVYGQLSLERHNEKLKFLDFVKGEFYKRNIKSCYDLQPELNKFITKRWKDSIHTLLTTNSNFYQLQSAIPISQSGSSNINQISVEHEKTVAETGVVLSCNTKKYSNPVRWSCSYLEYFFANDADIIVPVDQSLLQNDSVDVVITLKTLTSILTSAKILSTDWNVTFTVAEYENKNVIVFDEMLPVLSLECLAKNRLAYQYSIRAGIAVPKKKEVFSLEENQFIERNQPVIDKNSGPNPFQDSVSKYEVCDFEEYLKKFSGSIPANPNQSSDSNLRRRLWSVRRNNIDYCRLLIDNRQDFCEKQKDGSVKFINLSPKLEYQCEFGAEQMTLAELISEWCELRFGPNTTTHRVRINSRTGCFLELKEITINDVEYDLRRLYQIKTELLLEPLLNFIEIVKQFPPNEYLLSHLRKHNAQAMVYVKSNETSSTSKIKLSDIYKLHQTDTSNLETIPWNPIDDMTICPIVHTAVMPCAFPHWVSKVGNSNKRTAPVNDRSRMIETAARKNQEREEKKLSWTNKIKALKKVKSKEKKRQLEKRRPKLNFEGESLDPNDLFDRQGNIHILGLGSSNQTKDNGQPKEQNNVPEPMCVDTYCRDAVAVPIEDTID